MRAQSGSINRARRLLQAFAVCGGKTITTLTRSPKPPAFWQLTDIRGARWKEMHSSGHGSVFTTLADIIAAAQENGQYGRKGESDICDSIAAAFRHVASICEVNEDNMNATANGISMNFGTESMLDSIWAMAETGVDQGTDGEWARKSDEEAAETVKECAYRLLQDIGDGVILQCPEGRRQGNLQRL